MSELEELHKKAWAGVRAWAERVYAEAPLAKVLVRFRDGLELRMPAPGGPARAPAPPVPPGCRADILAVLEAAGHRLTTAEILKALDQAKLVWGESTVKTNLADMVEDETLTNRQDVRPRGYGLPAWP
jgi:hypothetical protein